LAQEIDEDRSLLCDGLRYLRKTIIHRAIVAWDRSSETFSEEIVALNDVVGLCATTAAEFIDKGR